MDAKTPTKLTAEDERLLAAFSARDRKLVEAVMADHDIAAKEAIEDLTLFGAL